LFCPNFEFIFKLVDFLIDPFLFFIDFILICFEEILDLFRNEASKMMTQLDNPANLPTGKELDLIVKNFGSLDAYRAKIQERINSLLSPGAEGYQAFLSALDPNYWSR
jgi:hypothetical protein